ncbi:unnamed protein product [Paramecium sonneborni]|uniref:Uncharacterized protein n=1 Tax=Paramecium sonneborni TaxID=65129 RepID=A0A8S1RDG3_9CILI|nr:unnamed protein product [Paramecium sonneborni]
MISLLDQSIYFDQYHSNHKLKSKNNFHRQSKFPEIENSSRFNISRGSTNSSKKQITSQERKQSLDYSSTFQGFKIRVLKPQERFETQKEEKQITITKSAQLKKRNEQKEDIYDPNQDDLLLPRIYSPIAIPRKLITTTKIKEQSIYKHLLSKQDNIDHTITIVKQYKIYDQLKKGITLKCLYLSKRQEITDNILIINFDNLILGKRKSFWEQSNEIKLCSKLIGQQCDSAFCSCALQKDLKSTLQQLSKQFYIIFIFQCGLRGSTWQQYLNDCGYAIDAIYYIPTSKLTGGGGIKIKQIISNFGKVQIKQLIYFGSIDTDINLDNLPIEQFFYQIPIVQQQVSVQIYFMHLQRSKFIDSKLLYEICMLHCNQKDSFNYKKQLNVINLELQPIISEMIKIEMEEEISNSIFKNLNQYHSSKQILEVEEEDKNSLQLWIYQTKKLLLDYFKSINSEELNQNPITLVGDFLRRNTSIEMNFLIKKDYIKQVKRFNMYNELKASTTAHTTFRKQCIMECFIIQD